ncbi:MAG: alanine dehydrogenase, partial [Planctomycetota bacterium]
MKIGTLREVKPREYRVALTPSCVKAYVDRGHKVMVEKGAGENAGFADSEYAEAGA